MVQVMELLQKLNEKANNVITRLLLLERKVRKLKKDGQLLRMGKRTMEEEEEDEEEKRVKEIEKEGDKEEEQEEKGEKDDQERDNAE